ncbi:MAG: hypothetical protein ABI596_16090 [Pyrinomonadaceae bacterium]
MQRLKLGFASKVIGLRDIGFAAGCEAVATPRRSRVLIDLGYALGAAFGPELRAKPKPGA